ncbi:MAG TPA: hypothetical protein VN764_06060 [Polyangiaceae bacterium]|nr:hypothetical protein [Polyangiaceae bacterium]
MIALFGAAFCVSCGGQVRTDRDELYDLLLSNELHEEHKCRDVLRALDEYRPEELAPALWRRIEQAEMEDVSRCLLQVEEYNRCYAALDCDEVSEDTYPAWAGVGEIPCSCGEVLIGPLSVRLADSLGDCQRILPLWNAGPEPLCNE